ncbi:TetR/AcrR family transcriptional regulator [Streptococcus henryi]|uniref:TetR/AcrR family transcriptional regulator n=1 Tax=Streptococcus henryi TaxID=439219 RepID=UPI00036DCF39|nr:TetR/AcrR family transcriptional regulator [Streptococcus henryi]
MTERKVSANSLKNLTQFNLENRSLTRESIETALLFFMETKQLSQITISELVKKAGVSRNAFYRNYHSKEDILEDMLKQTVRRVGRGLKQFDLKTQTYQAWLYLLKEARKEAHVLALIFKNHCEELLNRVVTKRITAYQRYKQKHVITYSNAFWSSGIISILRNWVADNMRISEEDLAALNLPLLPF